MVDTFKHPLARDAKIWQSTGIKGKGQRILVVITTLELDEANRKYRAEKVERLTDAAKTWLAEHASAASDILFVNRPKDWYGGPE